MLNGPPLGRILPPLFLLRLPRYHVDIDISL